MNNRGMCKAVSDNDNDDNGYRRDKVIKVIGEIKDLS